ncbi:MAG: DUF3347 domain-containing protein [Bacteroidia bacterium]
MKQIILSLALLFGMNSYALDANKLFNDYLDIKDALVKSDNHATKAAIDVYLKGIKSESEFTEKKALLKSVEKLSKAPDIEAKRTAFKEVSITMWRLVKRLDQIKGPVYYQYCPMKKAYWISKEKAIRNPYYGSSMLTCGNISETKI